MKPIVTTMSSRDTKRIQVFLDTKPISAFLRDDCRNKEEEDKPQALCDERGLRGDGRKLDECLPIYVRTGKIFLFFSYVIGGYKSRVLSCFPCMYFDH